ncbi:MAG: hypothetical protein ACE5FZ_09505 [Nitrospiria bacterium]
MPHEKPAPNIFPRLISSFLLLCSMALAAPNPALAQGGCGSVCVPLDALDPDKTQLRKNQIRLLITTEHAAFDQFREGSDSLLNPGGNKADISQTTLFIDYGISRKITSSLLIPYIDKEQTTKNFGVRVAEGIGDIALFAHYEALSPTLGIGPSISYSIGLKLPSGSIDEPDNKPRLPPAFQVGSGAYDLFPAISYFQKFESFSLFGSSFVRIPLESNKRGYKFGREIEAHLGLQYPIPLTKRKAGFLISFDYLFADHDQDSNAILPPKLRNGSQVLNTGGQFLDLTPGFILFLGPNFTFQSRFFIPILENWNGLRQNNVGQVAPEFTTQFTLSYAGF